MAVNDGKYVLLSIKPEYAEKIFSGHKSIELRRICPKVEQGDFIFVYVSSPVKTLMGRIEVQKVISNTPQKLWKKVGDKSGVSKKVFDSYYEGASLGFGILVTNPIKLKRPIHLDTLRRSMKGFRPPQNYYYVTPNQSLFKYFQ
jgi:predicted transcriptional regulator